MNMKLLFAIGLIILTSSVLAQVKLVDAERRVELQFSRETSDAGITETQVWKVNGAYSRTIKTTYNAGGVMTQQIVATKDTSRTAILTGASASITSMAKGITRHSNIALSRKGETRDPSVTWFVKDHLFKGATAKFMNFDTERLYWEEVTVSFDGRGKIGNSPEGNLVTRQTARKTIHLLLDDKGIPSVWEEGNLRLKR